MSFKRQFYLWILAPGAVVCIPLALLFLSQLLHIGVSGWSGVLAAIYGMYAIGAVIFIRYLDPVLDEIADEASRPNSEHLGELLTEALMRVERATVGLWIGGGTVFAVVATLVIARSAIGLRYFLVGVLTAGVPAIVIAYLAAKRILFAQTRNARRIRFTGRKISIGIKIAFVFIVFFIVCVAAMIELVSSKVSSTLERLALSSASASFDRVYELANLSASLDQEGLEGMKSLVPPGHVLFKIPVTGPVLSAAIDADPGDQTLTEQEIAYMRAIRDGDSSRFIAPHVTRFRPLRDGSIFAMAIPWAAYRNIPGQIAFYTLIVALITTALFSLGTYFLSKDIVNPIRALMRVAGEMSNGNLATNLRIFSDDEVGTLAERFDETRANLSGLIGRMGGSGSTITEGVRVITGGTDSLVSSAREQTELTKVSTAAVENVRGGTQAVLSAVETVATLTQDVSTRSLELQASAEEVSRSMETLFQSVDKTSSSTTEMHASASEMSNRTDTLANISEEVLTFVSEMDSTIEELRRNAISTADISRQVREDATAGGEAVYATVEGISEAKETSERAESVLGDLQKEVGHITQILRVIEEITDRTNLLALNAAIIAAQAGEHGAGFTVVADEIRELADRTRGSTKEIAGIIKKVQRVSGEATSAMRDGLSRVNRNVELAQNAAASLQKIMSSASQSYDMANRIAKSLEEQALASRHLHQVTSRMSDNISEINKATTEQARGAKLLSEEADRVRDIALQVRTATEEQTVAGRGISQAMEEIAADVIGIRDLLQEQLRQSERITAVTNTLLSIAQKNDTIAQNFTQTVQNLVKSGREFESEVSRFKTGNA